MSWKMNNHLLLFIKKLNSLLLVYRGFWEVPEMNNEVICNSYLPGQEFPGIVKSHCPGQLNSEVNIDGKLWV